MLPPRAAGKADWRQGLRHRDDLAQPVQSQAEDARWKAAGLPSPALEGGEHLRLDAELPPTAHEMGSRENFLGYMQPACLMMHLRHL
jgi:hypothetical protein